MKYDPAGMTRGKYGRLLIRFLNHDFLMVLVADSSSASWIYDSLEPALAGEFHFWLQRGSFELDSGSLSRSEPFLAQARIMKPGDIRADTTWYYLLLKRALLNPSDVRSNVDAGTALRGLAAILNAQPKDSPHTFDVFLSSGLKWYSAATLTRTERLDLRDDLLKHARIARLLYPVNSRIEDSVNAVNRITTLVV